MNVGLSDRVRAVAHARFVRPAIQAGRERFSIRVRDLLGELQAEGFPATHTPQICSALQTSKFLRENGLEIEAVEGPPSKQSPTVVVRYRIANRQAHQNATAETRNKPIELSDESPEEWAHRLTGKISGILKDELAEYGGGEAFLRWVRGYDEEDAA